MIISQENGDKLVSCLPLHGRVDCTLCYRSERAVLFDKTLHEDDTSSWRIRANPLAWGNSEPEIVVLGFSKGPTQAGALATAPHNEIAYRGSRVAVGKILSHVGVIQHPSDGDYRSMVDRLLGDKVGRFHFSSLIRCTVERYEKKKSAWVGSGGGMLDKFVASSFGKKVALNCAGRFLRDLPGRTKLVILFGLGTKLNYVTETRKLMEYVQPGCWRTVNEVAYTDGKVMFVHVEHFASQGALIPNWLGKHNHKRARLGLLAREAVTLALKPSDDV